MPAADLRSDETKYTDDEIAKAVKRERAVCAAACEAIATGYRMLDGSSTQMSLAVDKATAAIRLRG